MLNRKNWKPYPLFCFKCGEKVLEARPNLYDVRELKIFGRLEAANGEPNLGVIACPNEDAWFELSTVLDYYKVSSSRKTENAAKRKANIKALFGAK